MDSKWSRPSRVNNFFSILLIKAQLGEIISFDNLPSAIDSGWGKMTMVDVAGVKDYGPYSQGLAFIYIYVKASGNLSSKPMIELDKLESQLWDAIDNSNDEHYIVERTESESAYRADIDYHYSVTQVKITIK